MEQITVGLTGGKNRSQETGHAQKAAYDRQPAECPQRNGHGFGAFMEILFGTGCFFYFGGQLKRSVEGSKGKAEHIKSGKQGGYHTYAPKQEIKRSGELSKARIKGKNQNQNSEKKERNRCKSRNRQ